MSRIPDQITVARQRLVSLRSRALYRIRQFERRDRADPTRLRRRHMHHQYRRRGR